MKECVVCHRVREEKYMRSSTAGWRCRAVSTCKQRRLERRNRAAKRARLAQREEKS